MEKLISIIMPLYNKENYVVEAIRSVQNQTYKNWELIIIDDSSKDNGFELVKVEAEKDKRIKLLQNKTNQGVSITRNKGIEASSGDYLCFLDGDDLFMSEKLLNQYKFMEEKGIVLSHTDYEKVNEDLSLRGKIQFPEIFRYKDSLKGNPMKTFGVMINQKKIGKEYFESYKLSEDHVYWLKLLKKVDACYGLRENLGKYRILEDSRSSNKVEAVKFQWKIIREIEGQNLIKSLYYFTCYIWTGFKRYKV